MEYAIAIGVTLLFALLGYLIKTKERESFENYIKNEDFQDSTVTFAKSLELPSPHSKKEYTVKPFLKTAKRTINLSKKISQSNRGSISDFCFEVYKVLNENKYLFKFDSSIEYESLSELPAFKSDARIVKIVEFALSSNEYVVDESRIIFLFDQINRYRTISYEELKAAETACRCVLYKKLNFICGRIHTLDKLSKYAKKMSKRPKSYTETPKYKQLRKNYLFLSFCAEYTNEECPTGNIMLNDAKEGIQGTLNNVLTALKRVGNIDFLSLYKPLALLNRFDNFFDAAKEEKDAFLTALDEQATEQNMDEYAYTFSLFRYLSRVKPPLPTGKKLRIGKSSYFFFKQKNDMLLLARALNSPALMSLYFGADEKEKKQKNGNSILQNAKFENTFASIGKDFAADFGITLADGVMRINPRFNASVAEAKLKFNYNGVNHELTVSSTFTDKKTKNNDEDEASKLSVNGTDMCGVYSFKLTDKPLEVKYFIPPKEK